VDRLRSKVREDVKRVSRNSIGEVRDNSNTILGIRGLVGRCINGWGGMRKSRGRVRM
jgi:hypothetical protein